MGGDEMGQDVELRVLRKGPLLPEAADGDLDFFEIEPAHEFQIALILMGKESTRPWAPGEANPDVVRHRSLSAASAAPGSWIARSPWSVFSSRSRVPLSHFSLRTF